jgi:hypothetical protein
MATRRKPGKPKRVSFELIPRDSTIGHPVYALLDELVSAHHHDLRDARIALAWCLSWKPDVDGRVVLGKCKKASDLDRELATFDFVILLRRSFWRNDQVTDHQRRALLDHELHHAAVKHDATGEPVYDERGRLVYRVRKHEVEEFTAIVERYGMWTADLERLAIALRRNAAGPFKPCDQCRETPTPGWITEVDLVGTSRKRRCSCWLRWAEQREELQAEQATA